MPGRYLILAPKVSQKSIPPIHGSLELNNTGEFSQQLLDYMKLSYLEVQYIMQIEDKEALEVGEADFLSFLKKVSSKFTINDFFMGAGYEI